MKTYLLILITFSISVNVIAQKDKAVYKEGKDGFYQNTIQKEIKDFENRDKEPKVKKYLSVDFEEKNFPTNIEEYDKFWHNKPLSQGAAGTCWCFSGISFIESEVYRINGKEVKLSEMFIVYWEYVERAKYFVEKRGDMHFSQGSEANAVIRMMKKGVCKIQGIFCGIVVLACFQILFQVFSQSIGLE